MNKIKIVSLVCTIIISSLLTFASGVQVSHTHILNKTFAVNTSSVDTAIKNDKIPMILKYNEVDGVKTKHNMEIDGKLIDSTKVTAYNIEGYNYFKLRDIAMLLDKTDKQFNVNFTNYGKNPTFDVYINLGPRYRPVGGELTPISQLNAKGIPSQQPVKVNGNFNLEFLGDLRNGYLKSYNINGNNYMKLRDLGNICGFGVDYDEKRQTIIIDTISPSTFIRKDIPDMLILKTIDVNLGTDYTYKKVYRPYIQDAPKRSAFPKAPIGKVIYDPMEKAFFNENGVPVETTDRGMTWEECTIDKLERLHIVGIVKKGEISEMKVGNLSQEDLDLIWSIDLRDFVWSDVFETGLISLDKLP